MSKRNFAKNPVALVTGAAQGLGAAIAKKLASDGYSVVGHYRRSAKAAATMLSSVRKISPNSTIIAADLRSYNEVKNMIGLIKQRYGRLDVVVNNIGNFIYKSLTQTSDADWDDVLASNLNATFYVCREALPLMRKQKYGRIINIGAVDAGRMIIRPKTTPYYIAKSGVIMLGKQLAEDNARYNITINTISPGILESSVVKLPTPTKKYIQFKDITAVVSFLLAPANSSVNGANIEVAGGFKF